MTSSFDFEQPAPDERPRDAAAPAAAPGPAVYSVGRLIAAVRLVVERQVGLVWVAGEISGCTRAASGHVYFTLKDANAQVRCVLFRLKAQAVGFALRDGLAVEVRAVPTLYDARGEFQLNVDTVRLAGLGALYERFARLKARLDAAGWFDEGRKRPLPAYPRALGIVTSLRAAALRDVLIILGRRWPALRVVVYPAAVQGAGAALELAAAIRTANARREVDVLVVCRGGGSLEDLWAFNEEPLARAVFESALPIVSGVGHETDFTICDFVADARAPTPTAAATLATPDRRVLARRVGDLARRLARAQSHALGTRMQRLDSVSRRLVHPAARLARQADHGRALALRLAAAMARRTALAESRLVGARQRLLRELRLPLPGTRVVEHAARALPRCTHAHLQRAARGVDALAQNLAHLNPRAVLTRGYAIVERDELIVQDARDAPPGAQLRVTFARGRVQATVTRQDE
jgi:exodeoxyribonuclease VII large subunit